MAIMRKLPPLTELRAFEAAARQLSFKRAAAELGVTPTAVSHQIKLLERYCGQQLFRRRPRPLALTSAGQQLFPVVRDGFETFADAFEQALWPPIASYNRLVVHPDHRRRGIAKALDLCCLRAAFEQGASVLLGATGSVASNASRISAMSELGFRTIGKGKLKTSSVFEPTEQPTVLAYFFERT